MSSRLDTQRKIAKVAVAGAEQGPQNHRLEPDVVSGQAIAIIEPDTSLPDC